MMDNNKYIFRDVESIRLDLHFPDLLVPDGAG